MRISGGRQYETTQPEDQDRWVDGGRVEHPPEGRRPRPAGPRQTSARGAARPGAKGRPSRGAPAAGRSPDLPANRAERRAAQDRTGTTPETSPVDGGLEPLVGAKRAVTLETRLARAADAFAGERYVEARRILRPIVIEAPDSAAARELLGLTHYRLGKWKDAVSQLEAFIPLSGYSTEQHPVLADCYRALKRWARVEELWEELRETSPSAELVVEGRIVAAGALGDQGRLADAIRLLEKGWKTPQNPKDHHLRRAYALAALYERAGDLPTARNLFGWIVRNDPDFADAAQRFQATR